MGSRIKQACFLEKPVAFLHRLPGCGACGIGCRGSTLVPDGRLRNPRYPTPSPTLAAVTTSVNDFETAVHDALDGGKIAIATGMNSFTTFASLGLMNLTRPLHSPTPVPILTVSGATDAKAISEQLQSVSDQSLSRFCRGFDLPSPPLAERILRVVSVLHDSMPDAAAIPKDSELRKDSTAIDMKIHDFRVPRPLPRAEFKTIRAIAAAGLLLGVLGAADSRADVIYVANQTEGTIEKFASDGTSIANFVTGLTYPAGIAFDHAGNLYVSDSLDNTITKITPGGVKSTFASFGVSGPAGLAFDSSGNLYMSLSGPGKIEKYSPTGTDLGAFATGMNSPQGLAFDSAGNLFAADNAGNTIWKITTGGVRTSFATTGLSLPTGLAFDAAGNLYAANYGNATVEKFTPGGTGSLFTSGSLNTPLGSPLGLAFDSTGKLYVANNGKNTISVISPTGTDLGYLASSPTGKGPTFLAITDNGGNPLPLPLPEPTTLALAAMGSLALYGRNTRRPRN